MKSIMIAQYGYSTIPYWSRPNWNKQISNLLSKTRVNATKVSGRKYEDISRASPLNEHAKQLREEQIHQLKHHGSMHIHLN